MNTKDFRAIRIKNVTTLIVPKGSFDVVMEAAKGLCEAEEVPVTEEMLSSPKFKYSQTKFEVPNFIGYETI